MIVAKLGNIGAPTGSKLVIKIQYDSNYEILYDGTTKHTVEIPAGITWEVAPFITASADHAGWTNFFALYTNVNGYERQGKYERIETVKSVSNHECPHFNMPRLDSDDQVTLDMKWWTNDAYAITSKPDDW